MHDDFVIDLREIDKKCLYPVDLSCNFEIARRQAPGVVSSKSQFDAIINIKQFRVVVHLFGNFRDAINELHGIPKIFERPAFFNRGTIQLPFV